MNITTHAQWHGRMRGKHRGDERSWTRLARRACGLLTVAALLLVQPALVVAQRGGVVPGQPVISSPKPTDQIGSTVVTIRWQGVRDARSYKLLVREFGSTTALVDEVLLGSSYNFNTTAVRGGRIEVLVAACAKRNGRDCGT